MIEGGRIQTAALRKNPFSKTSVADRTTSSPRQEISKTKRATNVARFCLFEMVSRAGLEPATR